MLPKNYRLKKNKAFIATYNVKNSISNDFFILFAGKTKRNVDYPTKIGFVVSKKNHKRAVKRNRLKRLMRETFRVALKSNIEQIKNMHQYTSLVVVAKDKAVGKNYKEVQTSLLSLVEKLRIKN